MNGAWHGGKGDKPRPEAKAGAYAAGFDAIDWGSRKDEAQAKQAEFREQGRQTTPAAGVTRKPATPE